MGAADVSRRGIVVVGLALLPLRAAFADAPPAGRRDVAFAVFRQGSPIGHHRLVFEGDPADFRVRIQAELLVKIGPIPVFRYRHEATESWRGGRFDALESRSVTNGRVEEVAARRTPDRVEIARGPHLPRIEAPADVHPLTHWNPAVLEGPLFNPETGALLHEHVVRTPRSPLHLPDARVVETARYDLTGDAEITDWYDEAGDWIALKAKAPDGSTIEYRREGAGPSAAS